MNQVDIENALAGLPLGEIRYFDSIGSTNDYAVYWMQYGPPNLSIVIADEQTAGRGRAGRQWLTPRGTALAISVLLHPNHLESSMIPLVNGLGALVVSEALMRWDLSPAIKWPNDVLINGLKVAGVLPEAHWIGNQLHGVVLGMGVNVGHASVPPVELVSFPAGCVEDALGRPVAREILLREMMSTLVFWVEQMGNPIFLETWESRLAFRDEKVKVIPSVGEPVEGKLAGLISEGNLRLIVGKEERVFSAGEIRLRPVLENRPASESHPLSGG
jgi:BirA family transcriptional regulator, biotin operon repressor / biotin---[acetyl-CoA-carboxylase] ligase